MTKEEKDWIDNASYEMLLRRWRFSDIGDTIFQGLAGDYYIARLKELRELPNGYAEHVRASKAIGWKK